MDQAFLQDWTQDRNLLKNFERHKKHSCSILKVVPIMFGSRYKSAVSLKVIIFIRTKEERIFSIYTCMTKEMKIQRCVKWFVKPRKLDMIRIRSG